MKKIYPKKLKKGDIVAIISPSWGGPSIFPNIYENGLRVLKEKRFLVWSAFLITSPLKP